MHKSSFERISTTFWLSMVYFCYSFKDLWLIVLKPIGMPFKLSMVAVISSSPCLTVSKHAISIEVNPLRSTPSNTLSTIFRTNTTFMSAVSQCHFYG